jgi:outer membrane biosynthesis protein TonB
MEVVDKSDTPVSLEGEILQGRYAIVEVTQVLGDWIRCVLFDMQQMTRRSAVVELREGAEPEVQLLPVEEPAEEPPAAPAVEEPPAAPPVEEQPAPPPEPAEAASPAPAAPPVEEQPAPEPAEAASPAPAAEEQPATPPEPSETPAEAQPARRRAKTGRLEAAWFALGAEREDRSDDEEEPDVEDGDVVIAPSKVEQVASELTTKTYMRYTLDHSGARHRVTGDSAAFAVLRQKKTPLLLALVGLAVVVVVLLLLFAR